MARRLQAQFEAEAERKGLSGDAKRAYVGGAWQRVEHPERRQREWWRDEQEVARIGRFFGDIEDVMTLRGRRDHVQFKQHGHWFEVPASEYFYLMSQARELEREERREGKNDERLRRLQQKQLHAMHRAEYHDVVSIIRSAGGVKLRSTAQGHVYDKGEYDRLPSTVKASRKSERGLTPDQAREAVAQHMPWLKLDTVDDFYQYFEGVRDWRRNKAS